MLSYFEQKIRSRKNKFLSSIWPTPFLFQKKPLKKSGITPNILQPQDYRDLVLKTMAFPDNEARAIVCDKLALRGYVEEKLGDGYLPDLIDVCEHFEELKLHEYPVPFVLKPNHASGCLHLVFSAEDLAEIDEETECWMEYRHNEAVEWVYRNIEPRYFVEEMLCDNNNHPLPDYKITCFFGEPVMIWKDTDRFGTHYQDIFTPEWEPIKAQLLYPGSPDIKPDKPKTLDRMLEIARILSKGFSFIRVDLYSDNEKIYVGELTSFTEAGNFVYSPRDFDQHLYQLYLEHRDRWISKQRKHYKIKAMQKLKKADTPSY
ncbi:ATP-grasp fold amidoligase family protein [Pseudovibrio sp. Tun.PSC04-5.I4]|uniref:ATP-grasp fold amidoligase family protein n=1 Tax=Pseudovibrio sp. Tun.PSC04-5.I4 TaxID=1798213 RepID=UPI000880B918|nr:ATP-grasp fold amidoligase family protein [Pseudovibrio sp. Tun.PSC04-5.I4]SDR27547.1 TupA-like ATPgrasp [Pseudovibrio sp. Tun.PSC04-5.I4]